MVPKVETYNPPSPIELSSPVHSPDLFKVFKNVNVTDAIKKVFPEVKKEISKPPTAIQHDKLSITIDIADTNDLFKGLVNTDGIVYTHPNIVIFYGGENAQFEKKAKFLRIKGNTLAFLGFLLSNTCAEIMQISKLKIHIESR